VRISRKLITCGSVAIAVGVTSMSMLLAGDPPVSATAPPATTGPVAAPTLCPSGHGIYVGAASPAAVTAFEQWSGKQVGCVQDYLSSDSWADIAAPTWWLDAWAAAPEKHPLVLSVPLLPRTGANLAAGASGEYDEHFRELATMLVAKGFTDVPIRLGWEFNGGEFPWRVLPGGGPDGTATAANFVTYWRRVVTTMRSVAGAHFTFDWTVNNGENIVNGRECYPGDAYVDIIGIDAYDQVWGPNDSTIDDPVARWRAISEGPDNLDGWAEFARAHGKLVSVPEWGLVRGGHGAGDNPYYIQMMLAWATANRVAYEMYLDSDSFRISNGEFPAAAAVYRAGIAPS